MGLSKRYYEQLQDQEVIAMAIIDESGGIEEAHDFTRCSNDETADDAKEYAEQLWNDNDPRLSLFQSLPILLATIELVHRNLELVSDRNFDLMGKE